MRSDQDRTPKAERLEEPDHAIDKGWVKVNLWFVKNEEAARRRQLHQSYKSKIGEDTVR